MCRVTSQQRTVAIEREESPFWKKRGGSVRVYLRTLVDDDIDVVRFIKEQRESRTRHLAGFE